MATSSGVICGVCDAQHITNCAVYWCPECEEGLCSECNKYHSISKLSRAHGCIPVDQYNKLPSSICEIVHHCEDHGIKYTNYCPTHDALCCPDCISSTHVECKGFTSVKEIIKAAKSSTLLDNMEQSMDDIENNIEKVIQNRELNLSTIRQQRQNLFADFKNLRDKINSHLDDLEQNLITELNAVEKKLQTRLESLLDRLSEERKSVHALKIKVKSLKEHASDLQTFIGSRMYQSEVTNAEKYMKSLSEDGSLEELNLKCSTDDKILETLSTISVGSISIEIGPPSLILKTIKDKQAQLMAVIPQPSLKSINAIKLSLLHTYQLPKPGGNGYRGFIKHPNGKSILTDRLSSKLIELNNDGEVDKDIPCSSYVNDVTTINDRTVAVSTDDGIRIINIDSEQTDKVVTTSDRCFGITYHKGTLLWCEQSKGLQRMDLSDGSITTLVKQDQLPPDSYVTTYGDKIYQTNHITKTVTCYTIKGNILWDYINESVLKQPVGITVDSNGNIYITSPNSHDVVVIEADRKEVRQLLCQTDGLYNPFGIYFEKTQNNVMIVNNKGPALLYHVS